MIMIYTAKFFYGKKVINKFPFHMKNVHLEKNEEDVVVWIYILEEFSFKTASLSLVQIQIHSLDEEMWQTDHELYCTSQLSYSMSV